MRATIGRAATPRQRGDADTGFTLVEILVVLAIVAILAALLIPALASARQRGYQAGCESNLRQLTAAFAAYTSDWDGAFPPSVPAGAVPGAGGTWDDRLRAYVRDDRIYICPASSDDTFSYSYNAWIAQPERYAGPYRVTPTEFRARDLSEIPDTSGTILLFDVSNPDPAVHGMTGERDVLGTTILQMAGSSTTGDRDLVESWALDRLAHQGQEVPRWAWPRHFGGSEFGFVDGHVVWFARLDGEYHLPPS